jgi:hypothetical protein
VADSYLNSSGCRYRLQCSSLMAHRMVREEAARKPEPECRPTPALGTRGKAVNILLTGPKAKSRGTLIVVSRFCGLALAFFSVVEISLHSPGFHGAPQRALDGDDIVFSCSRPQPPSSPASIPAPFGVTAPEVQVAHRAARQASHNPARKFQNQLLTTWHKLRRVPFVQPQ